MSSPISAPRNRKAEDIEASQQLLGTAATSGPAFVSTGSSEARRTAAPATASTPPASPRRTPTASAAAGKRRCSRRVVCASALALLVGLGFIGVAMRGRCGGGGSGYINYDADVELPEGANPAAFPVSRDNMPGWMEYHESLKVTAEEDGAAARVLLLGDSITEELLETSVGRARSNWGSIKVWMEYYAYLGGINLGVSGDQTQHLLWRVQNGELPDVLQPESIMVAIGTNNLSAGMSAHDTVNGIKTLVKYLLDQRPDALVVVMALFPRANPLHHDLPYPWPLIDEVNGELEEILRLRFSPDNVRFVDCTDRFLVQDGERQVLDSSKILSDNLHLTKAGLDAWADCAEATMHSGLKED
eukprot:g16927.t1